MTFPGISDDLAVFYQSYCARVIMICNTTFLKLV